MGDAPKIEPAAVPVFDPLFVQELTLDAQNVVAAATIRTSRLIVLTQESTDRLGNVVQVGKKGNLIVYADVVRAAGIIEAHGRTMTISCRRFEFHPGAGGTSGFDVSGENGADGAAHALPADRGAEGKADKSENRAGKPGKPGADGHNGGTGTDGGKIQIYCDALIRYAPVVLNARGGRGGNGGDGQQGGAGGNGTSDYLDQADVAFAYGGQGGCGGNGGNGAAGGKGGQIELHFMTVDGDANGAHRVTYDARGGDGGTGGKPGKGGHGGDGGAPTARALKGGPTSPHVDGADAGGGGICGLPGYGGEPGTSGDISVTKPGDWCTSASEVVKLPDFPPRPESPPEEIFIPEEVGAETRAAAIARLARTHALEAALTRWGEACTRVRTEREQILKAMPHWPDDQKFGAEGQSFPNPNERAEDGHPGKGGPESVGVFNDRAWVRNAQGSDGHVRQADSTRNTKTAALASAPAHPTSHQTPAIGYGHLRDKGDLEQLEMILHHARTRFLLTALPAPADELPPLIDALQWLALLTNDKAEQGGAADKLLRDSALATLQNVRHEWNIFGKDAQFAALGAFEQYKGDLTTMLKFFTEIEGAYTTLRVALNAVGEQQRYLNSVVASQDGLITRLTGLDEDIVNSLKTTLAEVVTLEKSRDALATSVEKAMDDFKDQLSGRLGLTAGDVWNLFTQLSFTNREVTKDGALLAGGVAAAGAMILSQVGDLTTKAIENVATDTGGSVNKKYVIRRMEYLAKGVKSVKDLKQARDGLLKVDPSAEYRLQATREQVESICSNFYESIPEAKTVSGTVDEYIEAVAARNAKVEEYNQALSQLAYLRAELDKLKVQRGQASGALQKGASPGLPVMANFLTALRRHAQERCVEQLYFASRVYTLESLESYDVFADVLGRLASGAQPGDLNAAALDAGLIDLISENLANKQKHKTSRSQFSPQGDHACVRLTPKTDPLLFLALKGGKAGTFTIPPVGPDTAIGRNPFAGMSDIRLTNIRCIAEGMTTADGVQYVKITHTGLDTFVTEDGRKVQLKHNPVTHTSIYNVKTGEHTGEGALDEDHRTIGPCCVWKLEIPAALNKDATLADLKSIRVEFEGKMRAFVPPGVPMSGSATAGV